MICRLTISEVDTKFCTTMLLSLYVSACLYAMVCFITVGSIFFFVILTCKNCIKCTHCVLESHSPKIYVIWIDTSSKFAICCQHCRRCVFDNGIFIVAKQKTNSEIAQKKKKKLLENQLLLEVYRYVQFPAKLLFYRNVSSVYYYRYVIQPYVSKYNKQTIFVVVLSLY